MTGKLSSISNQLSSVSSQPMAHGVQLPCDGDGACMKCKVKPRPEETLICHTCITPWHVNCLNTLPESLASTLQWECPDCSDLNIGKAPAVVTGTDSKLIAAIHKIEADSSLTEKEKASKRQLLVNKNNNMTGNDEEEDEEDAKTTNGRPKRGAKSKNSDVMDVIDAGFQCSFCMQLPERPVTTPCGHNFCLKCFQRWISQGNHTCAKCRAAVPGKMASQPRINASLVAAIRMAKMSKSGGFSGAPKVYHFVHNQQRPEKAYTTERAKKTGKANACSGKIFVTVPPDHFGPILAENDPGRNQGVLVGECWEDRLECRQWGAHLPHVAGIAGQSNYGAQSVALSGGYLDDEDHGEWFLYTGSGGRDLSGNKRTNKEQSFDQKFEKLNQALRLSCLKGYPVRVVRSHKEKRSSYAPENGVRYDGVYRIEKCWRKIGKDGFKICRYLFVRCDNEPAPWTSDEFGDKPRTLPNISELKKASDITERKDSPSWDYDEKENCWKWVKAPPLSKKAVGTLSADERKRARQSHQLTVRERLLKEFSCLLCRNVMANPVTTPCAHNFCKSCLEEAFAGKTGFRERNRGGRTLRAQKNVLLCPHCPTDISDFLQDPRVNRELMAVIETLQSKAEEDDQIEPEDEAVDEPETEEAPELVEETVPENVETPKKPKRKSVASKKRKLVNGSCSTD